MARKKAEPLTSEQQIDLLKSAGKGLIDLAKTSKVAAYGLTSLGVLALGKAKLISCGVCGTLEGVLTYLAISDVIEEGGFDLGIGDQLSKGGASVAIGALWGLECEYGSQAYSKVNPDAGIIGELGEAAKSTWEEIFYGIEGKPTPIERYKKSEDPLYYWKEVYEFLGF